MHAFHRVNFKRILLIIIGAICSGLAFGLFLVPNRIVPGGVSGLAALLTIRFGWPTGLLILLINAPMLLFSIRDLGMEFVCYTLFTVAVMSAAADWVRVLSLTDDILLASLFGGLLSGAGFGLMLRGGGNSGGTLLAARLLQRRLPHISLAWLSFGFDCLVVGFSAVVVNLEAAMYAMICLFLSAKVMDWVAEGLSNAKSAYIISDKEEMIAGRIFREIGHGVTRLEAVGMYSGQKRGVLLCIVGNARELLQLKDIVKEEDESAFVFVNDVHEVLGEGFLPKMSH